MSGPEILRKILLDDPSPEDLFHGQGHDRTATALASAIRNFKDSDRAIGLDGPWGSGKSSVVGIAERKLQETNGNGKIRFHFFTFDIWKSQGSAFRRSFLEHLVAWAKDSFPRKEAKLAAIENKIKGKIREVDSNNQLNLDLYGIVILLSVPFLPIYVLWSKLVFDRLSKDNNELLFTYSFPMILIYLFLATTFFVAYSKYKSPHIGLGKGRWSRFKLALSQTLLIGAKQYEHQKVTQYIRETDPNDFEFQSVLREILAAVQDQRTSVIVVLDNIDRLPPGEIGEYWALVRSIFSRSHSDNDAGTYSHITAIVPYDRRHIADEKDKVGKTSTLKAKELFSKTFDEVLNVAPPVMSNTREFFDLKIREALPGVEDTDALFRVYLIFNWMIDQGGGRATPRQVISFINEVSVLYVLHNGRVSLPTVAVYLAVQDKLEDKPSALAKEQVVDDHLRSLSGDRELERNLAAILFNVEPELAFQLLLDPEIRMAIPADNSDRLKALAQLPGFDVRINDVFNDGVPEWRSASKFSIAISNVCDLFEVYDGNGASHLRKSAVDAFQQVEAYEVGADAANYRKLLGTGANPSGQVVLDHLLKAAVNGLGNPAILAMKPESLDQAKGRQFAGFLADTYQAARLADSDILVEKAFKGIVLPRVPKFVFGLAVSMETLPIKLTQLAKPAIELSSDPTFYETVALTQPSDCIAAFTGFRSVGMLSDDQWVKISTGLIAALAGENHEEALFSDRLKLLSATWAFTSSNRQKDSDLSTLFTSADFFERLYKAYSKDVGNEALAHAVFLAGDIYHAGKLATPTKLAPTGVLTPAALEEFAWFNAILEGDPLLNDEQVGSIVERLGIVRKVAWWVKHGRNNPANKLAPAIVIRAFGEPSVPSIAATDVIRFYNYIKQLVGEAFPSVLPNLGERVPAKSLDKSTAEAFPAGLLADTLPYAESQWQTVHDRVRTILEEVSKEDWLTHFSAGDDHARLLCEKAVSSGYLPDTTSIKDAFLDFVLSVLNGSTTVSGKFSYDLVMAAIHHGYHLEFFRLVREGLKAVTAESLGVASMSFPQLMHNVIAVGDKSKMEKEHLVRHILRPALEGGLTSIVDIFLSVGRKKVSDFIKASDKSTQDTLEPALRLFSKGRDYDYLRKVTELVQGKKSKSLLSWFSTKDDGDRD